MANNFDEAAQALGEIGQELEQVQYTFEGLAQDLERALKANARIGETGRMRNQTNVTYNGTAFGISMIDYAYFQIFGVTGSKRTSFGLPAGVAGAFDKQTNSKFKFRKIQHPGINPIPLSAQLIEDLGDNIADVVINIFKQNS